MSVSTYGLAYHVWVTDWSTAIARAQRRAVELALWRVFAVRLCGIMHSCRMSGVEQIAPSGARARTG